jgi:hypothetical protein
MALEAAEQSSRGVIKGGGARRVQVTFLRARVSYTSVAASAVLSCVESHLPSGSKLASTGLGGPGLGVAGPTVQSVIRSWPPVSGLLDVRWLEIAVTGGSKGGMDRFAESQSQWVWMGGDSAYGPIGSSAS